MIRKIESNQTFAIFFAAIFFAASGRVSATNRTVPGGTVGG
ncbi:hypothetical protein [Azospirillum argentinense]|uniref:Uncharacterized protein n=1 Tax=Azospirillum argentinense TaxID=2970906 RepID=A0A5B0KS27_9PROT|nr:hypothetical protein FH063_005268 [Azospirillum argentinense]